MRCYCSETILGSFRFVVVDDDDGGGGVVIVVKPLMILSKEDFSYSGLSEASSFCIFSLLHLCCRWYLI